jgi:hypothetical protein
MIFSGQKERRKTLKNGMKHLAAALVLASGSLQWTSAAGAEDKPSLILTMPPILAAHASGGGGDGWWRPAPGTSWQWQLSGPIDTAVAAAMYDIDFETDAAVISQLHAMGRVVVCYLSAGSWENFRADAGLYPEAVLGKPLEGWPDERWVDIRRLDVLGPILEARMDGAVQRGCDGIEPDNVDGYQNESGFPLSAGDQLAFNRWLAQQAHARNLSVGLKNDLEQIPDLEPSFDWALNEECFQYQECAPLLRFVNAGKAVFGVEYRGDPASFCPAANAMNFDWLKKKPELDAWRLACR